MSFIIKVPRVSSLFSTKFFSEEFVVQSLPWKVRVKEHNEYIKVSLDCNKSIHETWTYMVRPTITLLSFDEKNNFSRVYEPLRYANTKIGYRIKFIRKDSLLAADKNYVQNDTINLKIEIELISDLTTENIMSKCIESCCTKKRLTMANINNLVSARTSTFQFQNWQCFISIARSTDDLVLHPTFLHEPGSNWCKLIMHVKLISSIPNTEFTIKRQATMIPPKAEEMSFKIIRFQNLMDPQSGFVTDDRIVLEVEMNSYGLVDTEDEAEGTKSMYLKCLICFESLRSKPVSSITCGHTFCTACITKSLGEKEECPTCKAKTERSSLRTMYLPF